MLHKSQCSILWLVAREDVQKVAEESDHLREDDQNKYCSGIVIHDVVGTVIWVLWHGVDI